MSITTHVMAAWPALREAGATDVRALLGSADAVLVETIRKALVSVLGRIDLLDRGMARLDERFDGYRGLSSRRAQAASKVLDDHEKRIASLQKYAEAVSRQAETAQDDAANDPLVACIARALGLPEDATLDRVLEQIGILEMCNQDKTCFTIRQYERLDAMLIEAGSPRAPDRGGWDQLLERVAKALETLSLRKLTLGVVNERLAEAKVAAERSDRVIAAMKDQIKGLGDVVGDVLATAADFHTELRDGRGIAINSTPAGVRWIHQRSRAAALLGVQESPVDTMPILG